MEDNNNVKRRLAELAKLFLKLGTIGFGGPAAHIAMMEDEVVRKRKWMTREHFLDLVGATNLIPGPNSSEMAMHCGNERAGLAGLVVAGLGFIVPAVLITSVFAVLYARYGQLPDVIPFIYGIKPAVIAIIVSALVSLGKKALKNIELGILGGMTVIACLAGVNEIAALLVCGAAGMLIYHLKKAGKTVNRIIPLALLQAGAAANLTMNNLKLFWSFLKVGALLYGSGYVLFAFLDAELVVKGFLTRQELMDAIAVGQFTPGPVLSSATFIGWQLNGVWGALLATTGIFLPSFLLVALVNPVIPKLRKSRAMSAFLDAVNVASVAVIFAVSIEMGKEAITDWRSLVIAMTSLTALFAFKKLNSAFVVLGGSLAGWVLTFV